MNINFSGMLLIILVALKLTGVIDWSWWWVTAPLWFGFALAAVIVTVCTLGGLCAALLSRNK